MVEIPLIDPTLVKNGTQKLLIQVVGRRVLRCRQTELHVRSLSSDHVFILGKEIRHLSLSMYILSTEYDV